MTSSISRFLATNVWFVPVLLGICLHQWSTYYGLGTTYDSMNYLAAADSFRSSGTFVGVNGDPYLAWPPLFPLILSLFGEQMDLVSKFINSGLFGYLIFLWDRIAINLQLNAKSRLLFSIILALGTPILMVHSFLWSEPFFLVFLSLTIYILTKASPIGGADFVQLIVLGILMTLQRHAGIFFVGATVIVLYFDKIYMFSLRIP